MPDLADERFTELIRPTTRDANKAESAVTLIAEADNTLGNARCPDAADSRA